jgi:hypothetical protein
MCVHVWVTAPSLSLTFTYHYPPTIVFVRRYNLFIYHSPAKDDCIGDRTRTPMGRPTVFHVLTSLPGVTLRSPGLSALTNPVTNETSPSIALKSSQVQKRFELRCFFPSVDERRAKCHCISTHKLCISCVMPTCHLNAWQLSSLKFDTWCSS